MAKKLSTYQKPTIDNTVVETASIQQEDAEIKAIEIIKQNSSNSLHDKLIDIIQTSGSLEKELSELKLVIRNEITSAFNQGCVVGNGASRGAYSGEVLNLLEYISSRGL